MRKALSLLASAVVAVGILGGPSIAQEAATEVKMIAAKAADATYVPVPGFPKGADFSVLKGDPMKGAFEMYFRLQPGVGVPMHFHTSAERSVGVQGTITMSFPDGTTSDIAPGSYMFIPWKEHHAAECPADGPECIAYFLFDKAFDVTWVDAPPADPNPMPGM